jgi:hypothetical protein
MNEIIIKIRASLPLPAVEEGEEEDEAPTNRQHFSPVHPHTPSATPRRGKRGKKKINLRDM